MSRRTIIHTRIYFYLLVLLAFTLPLSIYATSVIQFALLLNFILEGEFREKWERIKGNKAFWIYCLFYFVHLAGMAWSSDFHYGFQDLKIKLPLLAIPFIIVASSVPGRNEIRLILAAFIGGTLAGSVASVLAMVNIIDADISDFRNVSLFISHIRFSLMVVLSIFFSGYLFFNKKSSEGVYLRILYLVAMIWFPVFIVLLRSLSGIVITIILFLVVALFLIRRIPDRAGRFMLFVFIVTIPLFAIIYIGNAINKFYSFEVVDVDNLDTYTIEGSRYIHFPNNMETENGNFVWLYVSPEELEREWTRVSDLPYHGKTENGDFLRFTLIRYLTSKGLRKDANGIRKLDSLDIQAIEKGIANHIYLNRFALYPRIYEVIWEFDRYRLGFSPNDKSMVQRFYYLKAGIHIAGDNLLTGVGNGDVRQAFENYYNETNSPLRNERRRRAHNQFLTLLIAFGIPGLVICIGSVIVPVFLERKWHSFMVVIFLLTMALSMLDEDTLENTPGAVMFGLFYALFIFGPVWKLNEDRGLE